MFFGIKRFLSIPLRELSQHHSIPEVLDHISNPSISLSEKLNGLKNISKNIKNYETYRSTISDVRYLITSEQIEKNIQILKPLDLINMIT